MTRALRPEEITSRITDVPEWTVAGGKLHREFEFSNFVDAFGFMTRVALLAERQDHHPDWQNVYRHVTIDLTTHDVGGISERDFELARAIDGVA